MSSYCYGGDFQESYRDVLVTTDSLQNSQSVNCLETSRIQGYKDKRIQGYMDTRLTGYFVTQGVDKEG